jgi:anti-sigma factor RsiW
MHCSDTELVAYLDGELKLVSKFRVKRHLNACWNCRARAAALEEKIVSLSVAMDRWSFPNTWGRVDAKRRLEEGMQRLEETLPSPSANKPRIRISYQIAATIAVIFIAAAGFWWRLNSHPRINAERNDRAYFRCG